MKEIEILYKLNEDIKDAEEKVNKFLFEDGNKFIFLEKKRFVDTYFKSNTFDSLNPQNNDRLLKSFRIREVGEETYLTYKDDQFDKVGIWLYSDELETKIDNAEIFKNIIKKLNFSELVKIDNTKIIYESQNYELVIESVVDLGNFFEVEYKSKSEISTDDVDIIKQNIRKLVNAMGIKLGEELNAGKPELMLKKNKVVIKE